MKGETALQKAIVDFLRAKGHEVLRLNSGTLRVKRGYLHCAKKGTPDILCLVDGRAIFFEVKMPGKKITKAQSARHREIEGSGSRVFIVSSVVQARNALEEPDQNL